MIKLEMLRVFRIVAEQGSLAQAADVLGRTPSAVSMMLAQFEDNLGAPLFEAERKNRLTKLGEHVLAEAVRATDVFQSSVLAIGRLTTSIAGTVRIAAVPSVTATLLPGAIAEFRRLRPQVRLEISDLDSASVRRRIRLDEADIGILTASTDELADAEVIMRDRLGIVYRQGGAISEALAPAHGPPSWELLAKETMIANPLCNLVTHDIVPRLLESCTLQARNTTALLSFVREGLGATILPESVLANFPDRLSFARPSDPVAMRTVQMIRSRDRKLSPAAQEFWNSLLESASR